MMTFSLSRTKDDNPLPSSDGGLEIQYYKAPNWVTDQGVARKMKLIEQNGLPSLMNAKRLTISSDRELFANELECMLAMLDMWPKFIRNLKSTYRSYFGKECPPYVMWIEFHEDGWPHFHMDWLCRHSLPIEWWCNSYEYFQANSDKPFEGAGILTRLWKLGHVHCKTITRHYDRYAFKYAFKPENDHSDYSYSLPDWFLDAQYEIETAIKDSEGKAVKDAQGNVLKTTKIKTFRRLRMWRPSQGYYTKADDLTAIRLFLDRFNIYYDVLPYFLESLRKIMRALMFKMQDTCETPRTVRIQFDDYERKVIIVARNEKGKYLSSCVVQLDTIFGELHHDAVVQSLLGKTFPTKYGIIVDKSFIEKHLSKQQTTQQINKICQLQQINRQRTVKQLWRISKQPPVLVPF